MREVARSYGSVRDAVFWLVAPAIGAVAGVVYGAILDVGVPAHMGLRGALIGGPILLYERGLILPRCRDRIRRTATPVFAASTMLTYGLMIVGGDLVADVTLHAVGLMDSARTAMVVTQSGLAYAFVTSAPAIFVFRVRDLIGPGVFMSLLLGLYHRPIREERISLFLDVSGSTAFADSRGDLAARSPGSDLRRAGRAGPPLRRLDRRLRRRHGAGHPDVRRGLRDSACPRCVAALRAAIERDAAAWRARFGQVPRFRAARHCGPVVIAEIDLERHKIAYSGDAVNTTARLEPLAKTLDVPILSRNTSPTAWARRRRDSRPRNSGPTRSADGRSRWRSWRSGCPGGVSDARPREGVGAGRAPFQDGRHRAGDRRVGARSPVPDAATHPYPGA